MGRKGPQGILGSGHVSGAGILRYAYLKTQGQPKGELNQRTTPPYEHGPNLVLGGRKENPQTRASVRIGRRPRHAETKKRDLLGRRSLGKLGLEGRTVTQ